jgi:uncharacterized protein YjbJ (UPF0337 family)
MNKDRIAGKVKDIAGRIERQTAEWTGDVKKQVDGTTKQVEGKVQNTLGKAKDAFKKASDQKPMARPPQRVVDAETEEEQDETRGLRR